MNFDLSNLKIVDCLSKYNYSNGNIARIKYIVIHYFGATGTAKSVAQWFQNSAAKASAHFAVDELDVAYRCVEEKNIAWHCGDSGKGSYKGICTNSNSIGIEVRPYIIDSSKASSAAYQGWYFGDKVIENVLELTLYLMEKYNIPPENVIRHYDVTAKYCPRPWMGSDTNLYYKTTGDKQWLLFKKELEERWEDGNMVRYQTIAECPEYARATMQKLFDKKIFVGRNSEGTALDASDDMVRMLYTLDKAGIFDK